MNKKKSLYEAPTTNAIVVRFEGNLLTISGGEEGKAGKNLSQGNVWSFDDED